MDPCKCYHHALLIELWSICHPLCHRCGMSRVGFPQWVYIVVSGWFTEATRPWALLSCSVCPLRLCLSDSVSRRTHLYPQQPPLTHNSVHFLSAGALLHWHRPCNIRDTAGLLAYAVCRSVFELSVFKRENCWNCVQTLYLWSTCGSGFLTLPLSFLSPYQVWAF